MNKDLKTLLKEYEKWKNKRLSLDMSRGKPDKDQLDLSNDILDVINSKSRMLDSENNDIRNYGTLDGIKECKKLFADIMEIDIDNVIIFGNSSLNIMYECISDAYLYGVLGNKPWKELNDIKWLCPVPGYDRHFAMLEHLGIQMINVPMDENGPDMDIVEQYIKDPSVKGIWCVPKYSNPTGITYSKEVVERFAKLKPAASDFRIYWDNAYSLHHLYKDDRDEIDEILHLAKKYHNEDIVYKFTSTSKISFPGGGVAALGASINNIKDIKEHLKYKTIGFDKINELRHVLYFKDIKGIKSHMEKHADILRPKFELIDKILNNEVKGIARWNKPKGGYFVSLYVDNKAKEVINRCKEYGVKLTEAGCAYPYHKDLTNSHIRLAPTYMDIDELEIAMKIICLAIQIETLID